MYTQRHRLSFLICLILSLLGLNYLPLFAANERPTQLALVIGNNEYQYHPLVHPVNDALSLKEVLEKLGFEVMFKINLDKQAMDNAIMEFGERLFNLQAVGFFYFAGHGTQAGGKNFLLPVNNGEIDEIGLKYRAFPVDELVDRMMKTKQSQIIVLDACRNNPYPSSRGVDHPIVHGLVQVDPPNGSIIAYATKDSATVPEEPPTLRNSLYARHLVKVLETAAQNRQRIVDVLVQVKEEVMRESGEQQDPWYQTSLTAPFCFGGCRTQFEPPIQPSKPLLPKPVNPTPAQPLPPPPSPWG